MAESRDANDPRDALRALRKEARAEFEGSEATDTGGQEHASERDREGEAGDRGPVAAEGEAIDRATRAQGDADRLRVPRGDPITGGGGNETAGPMPPGPGEPREE